MKTSKMLRVGFGLVFAFIVATTIVNSGAPATSAATPSFHRHQATAEGMIDWFARMASAGFNWIVDTASGGLDSLGNYVANAASPCQTQSCNKTPGSR